MIQGQHLIGFCAIASSLLSTSAFAQLTPDSTLGAESSTVTPEATRQLIEGGATRNSNLFHSFSDFNINENQRVDFANPAEISNIFTRVTGSNISNIFGTLGVEGAANLFLLNPNGIIFGPNAQLDIRGSFVATTAESLLFDNNISFSASNPQAPPLLTLNVPIGLQYGSNATAQISNRGNLSVGGNLTLGAANLELQGQLQAGGDLTLQAIDTLQIRDSETNPFIAAANGNLLVQGNEKVDIFALNHPDSGLYSGGDMVLRSANAVGGDAHYWSGGNFRIENLQGNLGDLYSPYDPIIRSLGDVSFNGYIGSSLHIFAAGNVNIPVGVRITGPDAVNGLVETVTLSDGSSLSINGKTRATLDVRAGMAPAAVGAPLFNPAHFFPNTPNLIFPNPPTLTATPTSADITIGLIQIYEPDGQVFLTNQYKPNVLPGDIIILNQVYTQSLNGNSGDVYVDSRGNFFLTGMGEIDTSPFADFKGGNIELLAAETIGLINRNNNIISNNFGAGTSGNVTINAQSLFLTDGSRIDSSTLGSGTAGNIGINAQSVALDNGSLIDTTTFLGGGTAGNVTIGTQFLTLAGGAKINTSTFGSGEGGDLKVTASDFVEIVGNPPDSLVDDSALVAATSGSGNAGNIEITTKRLIARDGGFVYTTSSGAGRAGNITVLADESVELRGAPKRDRESGLWASSLNDGDAGNIRIETGRLLVQEGGQVAAESSLSSTGTPGQINIIANESIEVIGVPPYPDGKPTGIYTFTVNDKSGGDIHIDTGHFIVRDGSSVSTGTNAVGDGGDLVVNASDYVLVTGASAFDPDRVSRIRAITTSSGNGGNLTINTGQLLVENGGLVSANSSGTGNSGTLTVNASNLVRVSGNSPDGQTRSQLFFDSSGTGDAGQLKITTGSLQVVEGGKVSAATSGSGQGGLLEVNAANSVEVLGLSTNGQFISSLVFDSSGAGNAGELRINTGQLRVENGGKLSAATSSSGQAGLLQVNASDFLAVLGSSSDGQHQSQLFFDSSGAGNAGQLRIDARRLLVANGGLVSAATFNTGQGGILDVKAADFLAVIGTSLDGQLPSSVIFDSRGAGNAGQLNIETANLLVWDGGLVSAATSNTGQAGILNVNAWNSVQVIGTSSNSQYASSLLFDSRGAGDAGQLNINTGQLLVRDGGLVSAITSNIGQGGLLNVNAWDSVQVIGTSSNGQYASSLLFDSRGAGDAGQLRIDTGQLRIEAGGRVSAGTSSTGQAGTLNVDARDSVQVIGTSSNGQYASSLLFDSSGTGNAGELKINTGQLTIQDGGKVSAGTSGAGLGGILEVNAADSVRVSGAGSRLYFDSTGAGNARGIRINTGDLQLENGGEVSVNGTGTGLAGDLDITANSIFLNQQGNLLARTVSGNGGNIRLRVADNVLLRFNSNILTEALGQGNGGNITIDAGGFVLAVLPENSDVAATAIQGRGGNIFVTAKGVLGFSLPERLVRTPESDISAASQLGIDGVTTINARNVPSGVPLPDRIGTPTIDSGCQTSREQREDDSARSQFFVTGRGGLPPNPAEALASDTVQVSWVTSEEGENRTVSEQVVEATDWVELPDGRIVLTAQKLAPNSTSCSPLMVHSR